MSDPSVCRFQRLFSQGISMNKKKIGIFVVITVFLFLLIFSLSGNQGLLALYKNHCRIKQLNERIQNSHATIDSLKDELVRLKTDTSYIEKIAREKLGMARKNEKVYKFVEEKNR